MKSQPKQHQPAKEPATASPQEEQPVKEPATAIPQEEQAVKATTRRGRKTTKPKQHQPAKEPQLIEGHKDAPATTIPQEEQPVKATTQRGTKTTQPREHLPAKARKKSERILEKTAFCKFTNLPTSPVMIDIGEQATIEIAEQKKKEKVVQSPTKQKKAAKVVETPKKGKSPAKPTKKRKTIKKPVQKNVQQAEPSSKEKTPGETARKRKSPADETPDSDSNKEKTVKKQVQKPTPETSRKRKSPADENTDPDSDVETKREGGKKKKTERKEKPETCVFVTLRNRCTPASLISIIECLNDAQRICVREMGFGPLLKMKLAEVPAHLSYYVLEHFNLSNLTIDLPDKSIPITRISVQEMLGLPLGNIGLGTLGVGWELADKSFSNWENSFDKPSNIRVQELKTKIVGTEDADIYFKFNFMAIMINSLCESTLMGKCVTQPLSNITADTPISQLDWCGYLVDCLKRSKAAFKKKDVSSFVGPCAYLVLLYLDNIKNDCIRVPRTRPAICNWRTEQAKYRATFEKESLGRFGTGEVNEAFQEDKREAMERRFVEKKKSLELVIGEALREFPDDPLYLSRRELFGRLNDNAGGSDGAAGDDSARQCAGGYDRATEGGSGGAAVDDRAGTKAVGDAGAGASGPATNDGGD